MSNKIEVYTIQMAQWRKLKDTGIDIVDVTIKSGDKMMSPDWQLLSDYRNKIITDEVFTKRYTDLMRDRYRKDPTIFDEMLSKDKIAIACYCGNGAHCHRYLLEGILSKVAPTKGISYTYLGEYK